MSTGENIVIVDDDASVRDAIQAYLAEHGYRVRSVADAEALFSILSEQQADLVILDLMMPGIDGLEACRRLAPSGQPILILSALAETTDRIVGLEVGAADYLPKPFAPRELLARVRAILRRDTLLVPGDQTYCFDGWRFTPSTQHVVDASGNRVDLSGGDIAMLRALLERHGRIVSRATLLDLARGRDSEAYDRAVDLSISRLRRKLAAHDGAHMIETVRGEGYRFVPAVRLR